MELISIVVRLRALNSFDKLFFTGHQSQGWFLDLVRKFDPKFADQIHPSKKNDLFGSPGSPTNNVQAQEPNEGQNLRPYTVSGLMRGDRHPRQTVKGGLYWLRFTTFDRELSRLVSDQIIPELNSRSTNNKIKLHLGRCDFQIEAAIDDPAIHEWAGKATWSSISHWSKNHYDNNFELEFSSPTHFRKNGMDLPLPNPWMTYKSYWNNWKEFSDDIPDCSGDKFIDEYIATSRHKIHSGITKYPPESKRQPERGFLGKVEFSVINKKGSLHQGDYRNCCNFILMLSAFSFYCGTGHHTTIGMGQTRLISTRSKAVK